MHSWKILKNLDTGLSWKFFWKAANDLISADYHITPVLSDRFFSYPCLLLIINYQLSRSSVETRSLEYLLYAGFPFSSFPDYLLHAAIRGLPSTSSIIIDIKH